ncbi:MAG: hypothetical protein NC432_14075, partial [Roseburia sp.]|nr:hypothetical protein [Roseburia sp.]
SISLENQMSASRPLDFPLRSLYHESSIHDRHSPLTECASAFFSLTLIISWLLQVPGRAPKNRWFSAVASLVKSPKKHLLEQAQQLFLRALDSALCEHYTPAVRLCKEKSSAGKIYMKRSI